MVGSKGRGRFAAGLCAVIAAGTMAGEPALAQERPSLSQLTCGSARALVTAQGAAVMSTGPAGYERFVRDTSFCGQDETTSPAYAASTDERQCFVGYRCRPVERGESRD